MADASLRQCATSSKIAATTVRPRTRRSIVGSDLDDQMVSELDAVSSDTPHHLRQHRLLEECRHVAETDLGLLPIDGEELHHATLAPGQLAPPLIGLGANGGQVGGVTRSLDVLATAAPEDQPGLFAGAVGASVSPVIDVKTASSSAVSDSPKIALSTTRHVSQLGPLNHGPKMLGSCSSRHRSCAWASGGVPPTEPLAHGQPSPMLRVAILVILSEDSSPSRAWGLRQSTSAARWRRAVRCLLARTSASAWHRFDSVNIQNVKPPDRINDLSAGPDTLDHFERYFFAAGVSSAAMPCCGIGTPTYRHRSPISHATARVVRWPPPRSPLQALDMRPSVTFHVTWLSCSSANLSGSRVKSISGS